MSGRGVISCLKLAGFYEVSQRGSHVKLKHADGKIVIVPIHRELAQGTLRSVLREAGLSVDEFRKLVSQ